MLVNAFTIYHYILDLSFILLTLPPFTIFFFFFFNDPAPPEISPLPLHAPLPILIGGAERIAPPRDPAHARRFEPRDPLVGEQRPIRAHHHRGALPGSVASDVGQVLAQQRLAAGEDQQRGGADREHLVDDAEARRGVELPGGGFAGTCRDVAMGALQIAAPRQVPRHDVGNVIHWSSFSTACFASSGVVPLKSTGHLPIFSSMRSEEHT